jgi:DNA-binding transcriptional LysR family regulator
VQDLDINLLKTSHAVSDEKHIGRAALRLGVTQPSVSHALVRLRLMFCDALSCVRAAASNPRHARSGSGIRVTLARYPARRSGRRRAFVPSIARRVFRLHMSDFAETAFLPALLRELDHRAPGVVIETLHVEGGQFNDALESGRIDLALRHFPHASPHFHRSELLHERYMLLMPRRVADWLSLDKGCVLERNVPDASRFIAITSHPQSMALLERHGLTSSICAAVPDFKFVPATRTDRYADSRSWRESSMRHCDRRDDAATRTKV